jgi:L-Ala-D/L-Glu epimerase / N-acetyl-D-glutamate racemase
LLVKILNLASNNMKIQSIKVWKENLELTRPYTIAYETFESVENLFVSLETDSGMTGIGAASPSEDVTGESIINCQQALENKLEPLLQDADVRSFQSLIRGLSTSLAETPAALAAVDIALHDLAGKLIGLPLVEILGRAHQTMQTSITIGIKPTEEETLIEAQEYWDRGFRVIKVKTGLVVNEDIERLTHIREKFGSDLMIRTDANQGYSVDDYIRFQQETEHLKLEFVEQPLAASDLKGMRSLPESMRLVTAADECLQSPADALECLCPPRPFGIFNIKLMKCGGISPGMEIARLAELGSIDLMWGCMDESIISISAALHAAFASPATRYLDLDGSLDLERDLVEGGFVLENGWMRTTDRPGLGVHRI